VRDLFETLRYDFPGWYRFFIALAVLMLCSIGFMSLPQTPFLTTIGITGTQHKVSAFGSALFWEYNALRHTKSSGTAPLKSVWGTVAGLDKTGAILVSIPDGKAWKTEAIHVADTKITNLYGAAGLINQFRSEDALLDYYEGDQVVIWIRDVPINVKLIEAGFARPDPNPPTNIVDRAFASYYWYLFSGEKNEK
jgi:hypothetical protein